ncbi:hypothetical protein PUN28_003154 [Cardiocondyla obscurior]|uniref:Uncharacterized protein n=1 Tax=Cardiocondyla obscurior TaxID=286306 RepID=A0AAW2GHH0_9HYME
MANYRVIFLSQAITIITISLSTLCGYFANKQLICACSDFCKNLNKPCIFLNERPEVKCTIIIGLIEPRNDDRLQTMADFAR